MAESFSYEQLIASGEGRLFSPDSGRLPLPPMLMFDRITHIDAERAEMNGAKLPMDFTAASRDLRMQTSHGVNLVPLSDGVIAAVYHCEFVTDQKRGGCSGGNVVKFSVRKSR